MDFDLSGIGSKGGIDVSRVPAGRDSETSRELVGPAWKTIASGTYELSNVSGEEVVDESELVRDDELGRLAARAFDGMAVLQDMPPLGIS